MKRLIILLIASTLLGCNSKTINGEDPKIGIKEFLRKQLNQDIGEFSIDTLKNNTCSFEILGKSTDTIIGLCNNRLNVIQDSFDRDCNEDCDLSTSLVIKSYVRNSFISLINEEYFECRDMLSPSGSSEVINFVFFEGHIYTIKLKESSDIIQYLDSTIRNTFDRDCLDYFNRIDPFDIYIENGRFFISNPIHFPTCKEPVEIPDPLDNVEFIKVK